MFYFLTKCNHFIKKQKQGNKSTETKKLKTIPEKNAQKTTTIIKQRKRKHKTKKRKKQKLNKTKTKTKKTKQKANNKDKKLTISWRLKDPCFQQATSRSPVT